VLVHAVVLPATVLLVPGAAGAARPLPEVRAAVLAQVARCSAADGSPVRRWGVLAPGARPGTGRRRPSLAAAGIADRWVPLLRRAADEQVAWAATPAGPAASVAQLVLAEAVGPATAAEAVVVELAPAADEPAREAAVAALDRCDALVVADDDGAVAAVVAHLAARAGWEATTRSVDVQGPHLPARYDVVAWGRSGTPRTGPTGQSAASANQPTPASSNQNRTVRPTRTVGT
jgi:hypothetical protein